MPRIHLNGTRGEYLDCTLTLPERPPRTDTLVIYLHGFASHQRGEKVPFLRNCFNRLGAAFLAFDHRGHGSSSGTVDTPGQARGTFRNTLRAQRPHSPPSKDGVPWLTSPGVSTQRAIRLRRRARGGGSIRLLEVQNLAAHTIGSVRRASLDGGGDLPAGRQARAPIMEELTASRNLEDLDAVFQSQARGFQNRVLIGSSMGGQTAAWYAAADPESVSAGLLIAPGFRFLEHRLRDLGPQNLRKLKQQGTITIKNKWISVTIGKSLLKDAHSFSVEKLLKIYRSPTLILHGTKDDSVPFTVSVDFAARARARPVELVLIGGGDHRLTEHKEALFAHMRTFCERMGMGPLRGGGTGPGVARNARQRS